MTKPTDVSSPDKKLHPLRAARRAGVPIMAFETTDPQQTMDKCVKALNGKADELPLMRWDVCRGLVGLNSRGKQTVTAITQESGQQATSNPVECLAVLLVEKHQKALQQAVVFFLSGHRFIANEAVGQAIWNLRDTWKATGATLVIIAPEMRLPDELTHDIVVVTEPLPTAAEIEAIVTQTAKDAGGEAGPPVKVEHMEKVVDTLLGISAFAAEQVLAMSISKDNGINQDELWERKRRMVEQTPGLSVWRGGGSFDDLGGLANIKEFLTSLLTSGRNPVRAIMYVDEIEKLFAGAGGDLSGVSQDQLRVFLTTMQDENIPGIILIGPPGTGKSAIAKAAGSVTGAEVIAADTGAMTGSLVGESQAKIRKAMATFKAVSQGKGLVIATCNSITSLPPELRRRFYLGTFFVELPQKAEREAIWKLWTAKYDLPNRDLPDDDGWTGAEIRACCDVASRTAMSLKKAAEFIVPVSKSAAEKIDALRKSASGKFINASAPGLYVYKEPEKKAEVKKTRAFDN